VILVVTGVLQAIMERLTEKERYDSMRGWWGYELHGKMADDDRLYVVTGDLGFGLFDYIRRDFPDRFVNTGAAEQAMMGIGIGLAQEGKIPIVYSITTFLIYRPFELIRNYVNHENLPVKLAGSGRGAETYAHDGFSHNATDIPQIITASFPNIIQFYPDTKEEIPQLMDKFLYNDKPSFISLRK